jgi:5-bromo-4-chloroindolyl phosphate hydrolysis protein
LYHNIGVIRMKGILYFIIRFLVAGATWGLSWPIYWLVLDQEFWLSGLYGLLSGVSMYYLLKFLMIRHLVNQNGLTRREYKLVERNLKDAKEKISRLQRAFLKVHNLPSAKKNFETLRLVYKIYNITKKEPRRFFLAQEFYYSHLDSLVDIIEKYTFLASQPVKDAELVKSLNDTKQTLDDIVELIEDDLRNMIDNDIDTLQFELEVAKKSIDRKR